MINRKVLNICIVIFSITIMALSVTFIGYKSINDGLLKQPDAISLSYAIPLYTDEELVSKSPIIIRGKVQSVSPDKWNTEDGKEPKDIIGNEIIFKDNIIFISDVFKGTATQGGTIRIRTYGGEYPQGEKIKIADTEDSWGKFTVGEDVILFLIPDNSNYNLKKSQDQFILQGMLQGKFLISDNKATNANGSKDLKELLDIMPKK